MGGAHVSVQGLIFHILRGILRKWSKVLNHREDEGF